MNNYETYKYLLKQFANYPVLGFDEQHDLLIRIKSGDMKAREKFINSNLKLVLSIIKKYLRSNEDINDIFEYGVEGLIYAIEKYDINYGTAFSTYAVTSIERTIKRKLNNLIVIPDYLKSIYNKYLNLISNSSSTLSDEDIMYILDIDINTLSNIRMYEKSSILSLDVPINESDNKDKNLGDILSDKNNQYDNSISKIDLDILLYKLKSSLSNYEYYIIYSRYLSSNCKTLVTLGKEFGITGERIRQKEEKILKKLKPIYEKKVNARIFNHQKLLPLSLKQIIILYNVKSICTSREYYLFYNIYLNILSFEKISKSMFISLESSKQIYNQIIFKLKETYKDYNTLKRKTLSIYTVSQIMEFDVAPSMTDELIDVLYFLNTISLEDITLCTKFYSSLDEYHKKLIYRYYNNENLNCTKIQLQEAQKEINMKIMDYNKKSTKLPSDVLYQVYSNNMDKFSDENKVVIEHFIFNKKIDIPSLPRNRLNSYVRYLYTKLEQLHYGIYNIFEDLVDANMLERIINDSNSRLGVEGKKLLELKYGINGEKKHTIIELADMYKTDYTVMHDKLRKLRIQVTKETLDIQGRSLGINKELYKPMINNPNYEFTLETRDVLYKYIILGYTYEQISLECNISKTRVSNIITDGIRKLDMYRYNILPSYNITKSDIDNYCIEHSITDEKRKILYERFVLGINSRGIQKDSTCTKVITKFMSSYDKVISQYDVSIEDYLYEINSHITDSVLNKEQMEFISDYYGIKCKFNTNGLKMSKEEIKEKYNINDSRMSTVLSAINLLIRKRKVGILFPRYGIIRREELIEILSDKNLPISDREKEILYYLKGLNGYKCINELELSKMFNMTQASLYRRYQRIILTIKKYQNGEIEGVVSYENDIVPILKYFSNYDKKILYFMYKDTMNSNDIMKKMNLTKDQAYLEMNRVRKNLFAILKDSTIAVKFDFDYAAKVIKNDDLPLNGNKELLIKIYNLAFGSDGCKKMSVPEITEYLNLNISSSAINRHIYDVMLAVLKYKDGYRGEKSFSLEQVMQYYNKYSDSMSDMMKNKFEMYLDKSKYKNIKLPFDIKYALLCENEMLEFSFANANREDVIKMLKSSRYSFSSKTKSVLKSYYNIKEREFMTSKELVKVLQVCKSLYEIKNKKSAKQKELFN